MLEVTFILACSFKDFLFLLERMNTSVNQIKCLARSNRISQNIIIKSFKQFPFIMLPWVNKLLRGESFYAFCRFWINTQKVGKKKSS